MPVLNEEKYLSAAVEAILAQQYPGKLIIYLAIGPSKDKTLEVAKSLALVNKNLVVLESPSGRTPDSLNLAIKNSRESIIVRVDAHAELSKNYISTAIETLEKTGADNVGGVMCATGVTRFERAVAAAMTSRLGVGNASFHVGGQEGPAETVYLGVFRRAALERVGGFDPKFTRAQDWELNHRIRSSGGLVWFNPKLFVTYRPRPNLRKLAKQYFEYGIWRKEVMREHPETIKRKTALRYFAPPLTVIGFIGGIAISVVGILQENFLKYGFLLPVTYLVATLFSSLLLGKRSKSGFFWLPLVLPTMQISWGLGFLIGKQIQKIKK
jgi:glycosyltransferase involved in cell wall biosynthesis